MIRRQITLPASAERVWEALTDPEQAAEWFGGQMEWDLEEGAPLHYEDDDGSGRDGRIDVVRPGRYLRYRWWGQPDSETSEVSYLLEPDGDGTRLTIQERRVSSHVSSGRLSSAQPASAPTASAGTVAQIGGPGWTRWDGLLAAVWATVTAPAFCRIVA